MATPQKRQNRKKKRKIEHLESIKNRYYIFCEGEKTEPNYFIAMKESIRSNPIYKNVVHIEAKGLGTETLKIINAAEKYVLDHKIKGAQIWCVYDKDSFPDGDFNAVSIKAKKLNENQEENAYKVAWSNQCIEYWFILHFAFYHTDNNRKDYIRFLNKEFQKIGLKKYKKNNEHIFEILNEYGDPKLAIKYAEKRMKSCSKLSDAQSTPATKVHVLVKELAEFFPEEIKNKYLCKEK